MTGDGVETELTPRIGAVAGRKLAAHGFQSYHALAAVSVTELLAIHGVGPKAMRILEEGLSARGLHFRADVGGGS